MACHAAATLFCAASAPAPPSDVAASSAEHERNPAGRHTSSRQWRTWGTAAGDHRRPVHTAGRPFATQSAGSGQRSIHCRYRCRECRGGRMLAGGQGLQYCKACAFGLDRRRLVGASDFPARLTRSCPRSTTARLPTGSRSAVARARPIRRPAPTSRDTSGPLPPSRGVQRGPSTSVALQSTQFGGLTRSSSPTRS